MFLLNSISPVKILVIIRYFSNLRWSNFRKVRQDRKRKFVYIREKEKRLKKEQKHLVNEKNNKRIIDVDIYICLKVVKGTRRTPGKYKVNAISSNSICEC